MAALVIDNFPKSEIHQFPTIFTGRFIYDLRGKAAFWENQYLVNHMLMLQYIINEPVAKIRFTSF